MEATAERTKTEAAPQATQNQATYRRECVAKYNVWRAKFHLPDNEDSLIEWDKAQNHKKLLDWDTARNIQRGLWEQAHHILSNYYRAKVKVNGDIIDIAERLKIDSDYVKIEDMTAEQLQVFIDSWTEWIALKYARLRFYGAMPAALRKSAELGLKKGEQDFKKTTEKRKSGKKTAVQ